MKQLNIIERIARGNYGIIYSGEMKDGKKVAIKRNLKGVNFDFCYGMKELYINLQFAKVNHPNIVSMITTMTRYEQPENRPFSPLPLSMTEQKEDEYHYVYELGKTDLYKYIKEYKERNVRIGYETLKELFLHICMGLQFMHMNGYIHRDIKPDNVILFEEEDKMIGKLCDFGFATKFNKYEPHTPNIVTSWYRAPEIIAGKTDYCLNSDIWSLGCVFYEMLRGEALLDGINNDPCIMMQVIIGKLPFHVSDEDIESVYDGNIINRSLCEDLPSFLGTSEEELNNYTCNESDNIEDLLKGMLSINPSKRYSIDDILNHQYFENYQDVIEFNKISIDTEYRVITVVDCEQRNEWLEGFVVEIFDNVHIHNKDYWWYKDRALFQTIYTFDRMLYYFNEDDEEDTNYIPNDKDGTRLKFYVILYFYTKYYGTLTSPLKFSEMSGYKVDDVEMCNKLDYYEENIISKINPDFEIDTMYEVYTRYHQINLNTVYALLIYVLNGHHSGSDSNVAYGHFIKHFEYYSKAADERIRCLRENMNESN